MVELRLCLVLLMCDDDENENGNTTDGKLLWILYQGKDCASNPHTYEICES